MREQVWYNPKTDIITIGTFDKIKDEVILEYFDDDHGFTVTLSIDASGFDPQNWLILLGDL